MEERRGKTHMHWADLEIWKKSHGLVLKIYDITKTFPKHENYALIDQIRRAITSVPANIVEGQNRNTTKEYRQFLYNARGSLEEVRYFLLLSKDLGYLDNTVLQSLEGESERLSKMLNGLIKSLSAKLHPKDGL
jgi:four helix bundle protein